MNGDAPIQYRIGRFLAADYLDTVKPNVTLYEVILENTNRCLTVIF